MAIFGNILPCYTAVGLSSQTTTWRADGGKEVVRKCPVMPGIALRGLARLRRRLLYTASDRSRGRHVQRPYRRGLQPLGAERDRRQPAVALRHLYQRRQQRREQRAQRGERRPR